MTSAQQPDKPASPVIERSPDARTVLDFHRNDDVDSRSESHHHTLGKGIHQAASGGHLHDGANSELLLSATITGSRGTVAGLGAIVNSLLNELQKIGITNGTTA